MTPRHSSSGAAGAAFGAPQSQRGVSLIIAMLMLVVIAVMSVAVMRNAVSSDQVATNNRLQTQANQAAQMALRYCEEQLQLNSAPMVSPAPTPPAWTVKANWTGGGGHVARTLAPGDVSGGDKNFPVVPPQCLSEVSPSNTSVYTVTARGFSADYTADTNQLTKSGSVVWLQSTVYMP
jgi:type IV pilus assembly protein PilX